MKHHSHYGRCQNRGNQFVGVCVVLWWSMQIMGTCTRRSLATRRNSTTWRRRKSGVSLSKWYRGWIRSMLLKFYTEIWSQPTCSSTETDQPNLVTWTSPKLPRKVYCTLKLALRTTHPPKSGKISPTIVSLISGHLGACSTSQLH